MAVLILLGVGAVLSAALLQVSSYSHRQSKGALTERQAYYSAMAGVEAALADIRRDPDEYLQDGQEWRPLRGAPEGLDYHAELSRDGVSYILRAEGGPPDHRVVYTLTLLEDADPFFSYSAALGSGLSFDSSNRQISLRGAPIYIEGNLEIEQNMKEPYELTDQQRIVVTGIATVGKNSKERPATAADFSASELITGAASLHSADQIGTMVSDLETKLGVDPRVTAYNPSAWDLYDDPAERVVFVDGSMGCDDTGWDLKHDRIFYGRLVVNGTICQPSSGSLTVYGSLLARGMVLSSQQDALRVEYRPEWIPRLGQGVIVSDSTTED